MVKPKQNQEDEIDKVLDELLESEPKKKKTTKKSPKVEEKVEEPVTVEDLDNAEKVSYAEIIAILCELPKDDFRKVVKVAKQVRRTNDMIATYFGGEEDA